MKTLFVLTMLVASQDISLKEPKPEFQPYAPISLVLSVAPGHRRYVSNEMPENGVIEVQIENTKQSPSKKWKPTAYISLDNDDATHNYFINLSIDTGLQQQYVRTRLFDKEQKEIFDNFTHQELFELSAVVTLKIVITGKVATTYVNGTLVETKELPYVPSYYNLGASSGVYKMTVIEPIPAPSPE